MAPSKAVKRSTSAPASPKKRSKVDPMFAGIVATLQGMDDLSEKCRDMLVAMAAPSLSAPKSERHTVQTLGVSMIEEKLQDHKKKLIEAVEVAQKELSELEGSKTTLVQTLDGAKATLVERQAAKTSAQTTHEESKAATKMADAALAEAKELLSKGETTQVELEQEKVAIEAAYQEHFKAPMDANEGPHHSFLKPFLDSLGLEDSLSSALPSSCIKTKEQRGGFDELVLEQLGKALVGKIAALEKSLVDGVATITERKAGVVSAEAVLEAKTVAETTATAELEAATEAESIAEVEVSKAAEEWATFEPRMQEATDNLNMQDTKRIDFVEGALKSFENCRDKESALPTEEEAAPLGA